MSTLSDDPLRAELHRLFGHDDFRDGQREIVESAVEGRDTLAVMPTGGGKSLTYQLPAMLVEGATLVLSPLIALMKDQVENLPSEVAERTTIINSSLSPSEVGRRLALVKAGRIKLIYAAPERLRQPPFLHALRRANMSLLVVDEAHCISQWGHDFRPDYRAVGRAVESLAPRSVLAVTATATPEVQDDIAKQLGRPLHKIVRPTQRNNLFLDCRKVTGEDEKLQATLDLCKDTEGVGLVYAGSREKCEQLSRMLKRHGISAGFYHAGLPPEERAAAQDEFMSGNIRVMVATVAFGMGVDKSDIRFLVHYHPSRTLENYYQEAGRAGRDGKPSRCTLLYSSADASSASRHLRDDAITFDQVKSVYGAVRQLVSRRIGGVRGDALTQACGGDENLVRAGLPLLEEAELLTRHADIPREFSLSPEWENDSEEGGEASTEWRDFFGAVGGGGDWSPAALSQVTGVPLADLEETLLRFQDSGHLTFRAAQRDYLIEILPAPADTKERLAATLRHRAKGQAERLQAMSDYARERRCRHGQIARYFGDRWANVKCGMCDVCCPAKAVIASSAVQTASAAPPVDVRRAPFLALQVVADLANSYRPYALGKAGLMRTLRGAPDAPVNAERTTAFGALSVLKRGEVERLIEALVEQELLRRDEDDEYRRLYLTAVGTRALADEHLDFEWRMPSSPAAKMGGNDGWPAGEVDAGLLDALKSWRRTAAADAAVPPYVIFADKVLIEIASRRPKNEFDLLNIPGIGPVKAQRYGTEALEIVGKHANV